MLIWVAKPTRQPSGSSSARAVTMNIGYSRSPTSALNVAATSTAATLRKPAFAEPLTFSAPDLLGDLDDQPQLGGLLLACQFVALDGRGEAALRRQAELVEVDVP